MPTTVADAFAAADLVQAGVVRWGQLPSTSHSGVYVVSLSEALNQVDAPTERPALADSVFERWLSVCPSLTLDGLPPRLDDLKTRVGSFWIPDEVILYIGLAKDLSRRLRQYYSTPIGAPKPHSGGFFLKLLSNLTDLWVHYAECDDPDSAEGAMLARYCANASDESRSTILDPKHPFPFANLEWPRGVRKAHGLRGTRWESGEVEPALEALTRPVPRRRMTPNG